MRAAFGPQAQRGSRGDIVAPEIVDQCFRLNRQIVRRTAKVSTQAQFSPPPFVAAEQQLGSLSQLCIRPGNLKLYGRLPQGRGWFPATLNLYCSGIAQIEVGPYRLCFQTQAPG